MCFDNGQAVSFTAQQRVKVKSKLIILVFLVGVGYLFFQSSQCPIYHTVVMHGNKREIATNLRIVHWHITQVQQAITLPV